jgi:glyoxylase-like metal-dependent hydrolase (beta-lactamase superfamily II)
MTRIRIALVCAGLVSGALVFHAQTAPPQAAYKFTEIVPGVYSAIGTGSMNVGSNSAVIVNRDEVMIVDSHISPESGRAVSTRQGDYRQARALLINTHFHYDHTNGNQAFLPASTSSATSSPAEADRRCAGKGMFADLLKGLPRHLHDLNTHPPSYTDAAANQLLQQLIGAQTAFAASLKELKVAPPNVTLVDRMTLFRGDREIRLLYLGHGHTGGDIVVYLPKEKVLCSGDLLVHDIANLIDGYVNEWPDALEKLKPIDFVDVIPGHGEPFKGKERIDWFQAYLRDLWKQGSALHEQKVPAADAAKRIDMTVHKSHYPAITAPGVNLPAVTRMYEVMEGRADQ